MPFDAFVLSAVADEITEKLIKTQGRVFKIFQINKELIITFRGENSTPALYLSIDPQSCRIHFTEKNYSHPFTPPAFCMLLRKHLLNGTLISVVQPPLERVLYLNFLAPNREGRDVEKTLVIEIMGKHSNLVLLDSPAEENKRTILGAVKIVSSLINRRRTILPHHIYDPPPLQEKLHPLALSYQTFVNEISTIGEQPLEAALIDNIQGISPFLAKELAARAGIEGTSGSGAEDAGAGRARATEATAGGAPLLSEETAKPVWDALEELLQIYTSRNWTPTLIYDEERRPADFCAFKPRQFQENRLRPIDSISKLLDEFYQFKEKKEGEKTLLSLLNQHLTQALKKTKKKEKAQLAELEEAKNAEQLKLCGELITLYIKEIPPQAKEVSLVNLYDPEGGKVNIILDPRLSPASNAQRYFKLYRKARQAEKKISERLTQTRQELTYIESVRFSTEKADLPTLLEIREELEETGFLPVKGKPLTPKKTNYFNLMRYYASQGEEIYVGKNNRQNEHLIHRFAAKTDLWLHVKDMPGAHVIIRSKNPDETTIREAALLAAYYSKGTDSSNVPVDFTQVMNTKRHPSGKPGMVTYTNYKTIFVTPDKELLQPILTRTEHTNQ